MKKKTKKLLMWVGALLGAVVVLGSATALSRGDTVKLNRFTGFEVGAVETDGKVDSEAKTNIVSNMVAVEKLTVKVGEGMTYKIHYFDEDGEYLESTESMTSDYDENVMKPAGAKKAIVEITVTDDDDISFRERLDYLKDVTVEYVK